MRRSYTIAIKAHPGKTEIPFQVRRYSMLHKCGFIAVLFCLMTDAAVYGQKTIDFSTFVVAGDSLSAGYQNAQLNEFGQVHGYACLFL
jgi:hypothetical protein